MTNEQEKLQALAQLLEIKAEDITETSYGEFEAEGGDYKVLTDDEANDEWEEELDRYIDDCILPELNEAYRFYFDDEKWKSDAKMDGRGHSLNHYDGGEEEQKVNETIYYIYRTN